MKIKQSSKKLKLAPADVKRELKPTVLGNERPHILSDKEMQAMHKEKSNARKA